MDLEFSREMLKTLGLGGGGGLLVVAAQVVYRAIGERAARRLVLTAGKVVDAAEGHAPLVQAVNELKSTVAPLVQTMGDLRVQVAKIEGFNQKWDVQINRIDRAERQLEDQAATIAGLVSGVARWEAHEPLIVQMKRELDEMGTKLDRVCELLSKREAS